MKSRNAEPEVMLPLFLPLAVTVQAGGSFGTVAVARAATAVLASVHLFPPPDGIRIKRTCVCSSAQRSEVSLRTNGGFFQILLLSSENSLKT